MDIPRLSVDGQSYSGIQGYSDFGVGWGGEDVDIPGLSMDGHSYSGIRDSLTWRGRVDIHGLSMDGHSYSQLSTKQLYPSMDGRGLSMAPLDMCNKRVIQWNPA